MSTVLGHQTFITASGLAKVRSLLEDTKRRGLGPSTPIDAEARSFLARFTDIEVSGLEKLARSGTLFSAMNENFGLQEIDTGGVRGDAVLGPYFSRFTNEELLDIHKAMLAKQRCDTV